MINANYERLAWISNLFQAIATAQPDPLDALSPEDRLGYVAAVKSSRDEDAYMDFATEAYITDRDKRRSGSLRNTYNAMAAAVIAEYKRQKGGAK